MGNSTFRTQNDTDSANFQYAVNKKIVLKTSSQVGLKSGKGGGGGGGGVLSGPGVFQGLEISASSCSENKYKAWFVIFLIASSQIFENDAILINHRSFFQGKNSLQKFFQKLEIVKL